MNDIAHYPVVTPEQVRKFGVWIECLENVIRCSVGMSPTILGKDFGIGIFKYVMEFPDITFEIPYITFGIPPEEKILSLGVLNGQPVVYTLVDPKQPPEMRRFIGFDTGEEIKFSKGQTNYIGTAIWKNGVVSHIFEVFVYQKL